MNADPRISVAVFAYNEEAGIAACLDALAASAVALAADDGGATGPAAAGRVPVHVLVNGCSDGTERVVRAYAAATAADPAAPLDVRPAVIARGDKANAWNHYVHDLAPTGAAAHVFTDGDMVVTPGTLAGFLRGFAARPEADGLAGLPVSGRSRDAFRDKLVRGGQMAGNLYALRGRAVGAFRARGVRLPFGVFGEDGLVTTLVKYGLDTRGAPDARRVGACEEAGFAYAPLSPWRPRDWRTYRNRRMRYAVRRQQANMLYPLLFSRGVGAMPAHVLDLYREHHALMERGWNGLDTYFDWVARRRILRDVAAGERARLDERAHLYS